jgi:hypothetical protein
MNCSSAHDASNHELIPMYCRGPSEPQPRSEFRVDDEIRATSINHGSGNLAFDLHVYEKTCEPVASQSIPRVQTSFAGRERRTGGMPETTHLIPFS